MIPANVRRLLKKELEGDFTHRVKFCSNRYRLPPLGTEQMTLGRLRPKKAGIVKLAAAVVGTGGCTYRVDLSGASARVLGGGHCYNE
ncbi:MAG: hypothetical protein JJE05_05355 [Actinobacteria bacterium]|nr:hypothetical protein [Actinomycetota bacterium]